MSPKKNKAERSRKRGPRPHAPGIAADQELASVIRVDHAGEYGAVRIYEGQLAVLRSRKAAAHTVAAIERMAAHEQRHLKAFDALINQRRVRPTALEPVWRVAGYALGALTAIMGEETAMTCTAAVEDVIDAHYASQLARPALDPEIKSTVEDFRADEIAHRDEARSLGAESTPMQRALSEAIKTGCRIAIRLSERI